jgi:orotidine-5'-phosphate decarboxylase
MYLLISNWAKVGHSWRRKRRHEGDIVSFVEKLRAASRTNDSLLCVGLDPEPSRFPAHYAGMSPEQAVRAFCLAIIEATAPYVSAFKPNSAFFEVLGPAGLQVLQEVIKAVPAHIPVILDAKRGDMGNTARNYAKAVFEVYHADAVTVNPYQGYDAVLPFLEYSDKGVILLCRTSNPGSRDFQDLRVQDDDGQARPLYEVVARRIQSWNKNNNCGMVVGATYPEELRELRAICPTLPILIPGVGAQGGDLEASVQAGVDAQGELAIISASRSVLYASDPAHEARALRDAINEVRRGG